MGFVRILKESGFSLNDILKRIFLFEQFLSLATLKPLESSKIVLYDKSRFQELKNGKKIFSKIEYVRVFHGKNVEQQYNFHEEREFLFSYETIKSEFGVILRKWFTEQDDISPIRHHLIECIRKKRTFSSVDFLIVIQAIEGFWWRFRDDVYKQKNNISHKVQTKLKIILKELILEFEDIERLKLREINVDEVVDSRHYYSHFVHKVTKSYAKDGLELYNLTCQIRKLLICCILNFVGFTNDRIANIVKESNSSFLYD